MMTLIHLHRICIPVSLQMFAKATRKFVTEIDPDGCLIPVSRLNDSDKLLLLSIVVKSKPVWFWKPPKYIPSDFTLSDVLLGDKEIKAGMFKETYGITIVEMVWDSCQIR